MRILVLNGSPRANGNTEILSEAFRKGAEEAGNEVEVVNLRGKKIGGCLACKYCFSHGGQCVQQDDMQDILAKLDEADMLVLSSPIYWFDITAQLKAAIDRMYAKASVGFHLDKTALLLNSGADHVYDAAIAQYKAMTSYLKWEDKGIVTAPNMVEKGSARQSPALQQAYELGLSLTA
ncbi:MAG: flavodoxin family protein [Coriobacteriales bacterium]|jgi:multimeric flavodoxin WrbA